MIREHKYITAMVAPFFIVEFLLVVFILWSSSAENNMGGIVSKVMHGYVEYGLAHDMIKIQTFESGKMDGESVAINRDNLPELVDVAVDYLLNYRPRNYDVNEWEFLSKKVIKKYNLIAFLKWLIPVSIIAGIVANNFENLAEIGRLVLWHIWYKIAGISAAKLLESVAIFIAVVAAFYGHIYFRCKKHRLKTIIVCDSEASRKAAADEIKRREEAHFLMPGKYKCSENVEICDLSKQSLDLILEEMRISQVIISLEDPRNVTKAVEICRQHDVYFSVLKTGGRCRERK